MSDRRALEGCLILLVLSGAGTLSFAEASPFPVLVLGIVCLHQAMRGWRPLLSRSGLNLAASGILVFALIDYTILNSWDSLLTLGHVVVGMQAIRIYQGWRLGGVWRIVLLGFMEIVVAAAIMVSGSFILPFVAYLVFAVLVLSLYQIQDQGFQPPGRVVPLGVILRLAAPALMVLAAGGAIFLAVPRVGAGAFGTTRGRATSMIGFGDSVRLDDIGQILDNPEVVMQVVTEPLTVAKLWRGKVFDSYDGSQWKPLRSAMPWIAQRRGTREFLLDYQADSPGRQGGTRVTQTIALNPIEPKVIFACLNPSRIRFLTPPPRELRLDGARAITTKKSRGHTIAYEVTSRLPDIHLAAGVREDEINKTSWLSLDSKAIDIPRYRKLAAKIVRDAEAESPYEKARAIERYLQEEGRFGYTLDRPAKHPDAKEPVESFLFYNKQGHCQYFASAMVLLLRAIEIPSRVVNGFRDGDWNPLGNFYLVRQRHAHSWAEVEFGSKVGWIPMDPSPSGGVPNLAFAFQSLGNFVDYLRYQWVTRVITYNFEDQASALRWISDRLDRVKDSFVVVLSSIKNLSPVWWILAAALVVAPLIRRRALGGKPGWRATSPRVSFYRELVRALSRRGFERNKGETPMEFAGRVRVEGVVGITDAYYRVRFGGRVLSREETSRIRGVLSAIRSSD
ncbi:MAG: DUF3488 and transglutaminase-like domain-containing protein [Planctomycetota bacterium]|nr:DUF3488 and transglutaminase-like domain-containing protein [Planctomycetota bacterium]